MGRGVQGSDCGGREEDSRRPRVGRRRPKRHAASCGRGRDDDGERARERRGCPRARPLRECAFAQLPSARAPGSAGFAAQRSVTPPGSLSGCNGPVSWERSAHLRPSPPTPSSQQTLSRAVFSLLSAQRSRLPRPHLGETLSHSCYTGVGLGAEVA